MVGDEGHTGAWCMLTSRQMGTNRWNFPTHQEKKATWHHMCWWPWDHLSNINHHYPLNPPVSVSKADTSLLCITFQWTSGASPQNGPIVTATTKAEAGETLCTEVMLLSGTWLWPAWALAVHLLPPTHQNAFLILYLPFSFLEEATHLRVLKLSPCLWAF